MDESPDRTGVEALVVCVSRSHGNTRRVADAIAGELGADVIEPEDVVPGELDRYDVVGFGSGIYFSTVDRRLRHLVDHLPRGDGRCAFTFSTSGTFLVPWRGVSGMRNRLRDRGYHLVGDFNCRGLDTVGPLRFVGGLNRGRPDADDIARAEAFARDLRAGVGSPRGAVDPHRRDGGGRSHDIARTGGRPGGPAMHADVGDRIVVRGHRAGEHDRWCLVLEQRGPQGDPPYLVRWGDDGHEGLYFPGSDALVEPADAEEQAHRDDPGHGGHSSPTAP